ncbi:Z231 [Enterospora canceri]|uniref:Z231 n=1 Tax=Enterospora canceri TaxID=1081671 RepID=A0A1Y1S8P8_9MICR|nr:Z231 [Enterospora canceri]
MRKCTKKSKQNRNTRKLVKLTRFISRPLDQIKTERVEASGEYVCEKCDRIFKDEHTLTVHLKTRAHKRREKEWNEEYHTRKDAEMAAGLF